MKPVQSLTALISLISLLLCSCNEPEPLKIGFLGSLSGRASELCISARDGVQLAIDEINAQGGLNGRQAELVVFDHQNSATKAREGVNALTDAGVVGIIGPSTSEMSQAATPAANTFKTVLISPTTSTEELSGLDDYFFRVYPTSEANALWLADYAVVTAKNQRIAILSNLSNKAFTEPWQAAFSRRVKELGGEIAITISFNSEDQKASLLELAKEIVAVEPDGILLLTNSIDAGLFSQQIRKLTDGINLYGSDWTFSGELVQYGGKSVEGFTFTTNIDMNDESVEFRAFKINFAKRFDRAPNFPSVFAYEATQLLFDALITNPSREDLPETLKNLARVQGLQDDYKLDDFGDIERAPYLNQVRGGEFVRVTIP